MSSFSGAKKKSAVQATAVAATISLIILTAHLNERAESRPMISLSRAVTVTLETTEKTKSAKIISKGVSANNVSEWLKVRMRVTGYCPCRKCCGPLAQGITANGWVIRRGDRFAAAPKEYPFGTELIVPQYNGGRAIKVIDRGGAIKGNRLDLFFPNHEKAAQWGVKYLDVKIRN